MLFHRHLLVLLFSFSACLLNLSAQERTISDFYKTDKGTPVLFTFDQSSFPSLNQQENAMKEVLSLRQTDNFVTIRTDNDDLGFEHIKHQQFYNGIKVEYGTWTIHARNGKIESMSGNYIPVKDVNTVPQITENEALDKALDYIGAQSYKWMNPLEENWLKTDMNDPTATFYPKGELVIIEDFSGNKTVRLAWKFNIYAQEPLSRDYVYIDAENGKLIFKDPIIKHTNTPGTADTRYSGTRNIVADSYGGSYRLRENRGTNSGIQTFDLNATTNYNNAVDFVDNDNNWSSAEWNNAQKDNAALDAHWGAENTYDYFLLKHNRNSYNGSGGILKSYVHYSTNYDNAFWDGTRMTYGDGGSVFKPLTGLDVCGHEIAHGVCEYTANLVYSYESGALNEALSDIWGACIEYYAAPEKNTWLLGEDITQSGGGLRSLINPNAYSDPDTYLGTYWYSGSGDNGGVHTNSGVLNFFFYLLVNGGNGTNDIGNAYSVTGIGIEDAAKIVYRAESVYMSSNTNYPQTRTHMIQAAIDLFGAGSAQVISTTNAMYAVGIGSVYGGCEQPTGLFVYNITSSGAVAAWSPAEGSVSYTLEYKAASSSSWIVVNGLTATTYTFSGLALNTAYNYRVKNNCSTNSSAYSTYNFTTQISNACPESLELNNTFATAAIMPVNTPVNALIQINGDNDYYKFTTTATGTLTITLTSIPFDYDLKLYNASGTQLGVSENGNTTNETITYNNAAPGTYYVYVYGWSGANDRNDCYILTSTVPAGPPACVDNHEPNNTLATAKVVNTGSDVEGLINPAGDPDYFTFSISAVSNLSISLSSLPDDYDVILYDAGGTQLAISENGSTNNELISYNNAAPGSYIVYVYGYNGANNAGDCYLLRADAISLGCTDLNEPNNTLSTAKIINTGVAVDGLIDPAGDLDYYAFTVTGTNNLSIGLSSLPANYDMILYNNVGTQLGSSSNTGSLDETITYNNAAPGTYIVYIYGNAGANHSSDCYTLTANATSVACTDTYENNNTTGAAKVIPVNTDISAKIGTSTDQDWFKFSNTSSQPNIRVTLSNLPSNYNLRLSRGSTSIAQSNNNGTTNETITYNTSVVSSDYRIRVFIGSGGAMSNDCYTLRASISATPFVSGGLDEDSALLETETDATTFSEITVFPNPVRALLRVIIPAAEQEQTTQISILDGLGNEIEKMEYVISHGNLDLSFDMRTYPAGLYYVKVQEGDQLTVRKFVVVK